jgi:spermidine synthase
VTRAWTTLDAVDTPDGRLELRQRGDDDFLITLAGRVLMNSRASRSEAALGQLAAQAARANAEPRLLIGGLGMGCTLRAALDVLPDTAEVVVSELNEVVVRWCNDALASLTGHASGDARARIEIGNVADRIAAAAGRGGEFHAIALDLYEGPHAGHDAKGDPLFGRVALATTHRALLAGGTFAVWTEHRDAGYEKRLRAAGFGFEVQRPGRGGLRHTVYLARSRDRGARR